MAVLRFPGTVLANGWFNRGGVTGGWSPAPGSTDAYIAVNLEQHRIYLAPARYSQVKKVVFTITFQHIQNSGGDLATTFVGRIAPSSTSTTTRTLETATIAAGSRQVTNGAGQIWTNGGPQADAAFYPLTGQETTIAPRRIASPLVSTAAQTLIVTFDREDPGSADFFTDWDSVVAGDDDVNIAYAAGIQRTDLAAFNSTLASASNVPTAMGFTVAVIQAPSVQNDSCTHVQVGCGLYPDESMNGATYVANKVAPFHYRAADWDGIDSIHVLLRQTSRSGAISNGWFNLRVFKIEDQSTATSSIYEEAFGTSGVTSATLVCRSADIKASLVDGGIYIINFQTLTGNTNQDMPWGWFEVIQKGCSQKSTFHSAGGGIPSRGADIQPSPPTIVGSPSYAVDQTIFDPEWYQGFPDAYFSLRNFYGGINHIASCDTDLSFVAALSASEDIPASLTTQRADEASSTPDGTTGYRAVSTPMVRFDPLLLSGIRVLKMRYNRTDWTSSTPDDGPGSAGLQYSFFVPDSDILNLGPIFEVGAFNPEGCASTAAGLGDNPGVLILTNGSTVPKKFDPRSGIIDNAGMATPYRDQEPTATPDSVALSPEGGLTPGIYKYRYTLRNCCTGKESDPNPVDITVDGSAESPGLEVTLDFSGVFIPADTQICEICVYRTILGGDFPVMAKVGCFDPDVTSTLVDILPDGELDFINDSLSVLNAPMPCVTSVAEFRNRLFGLGDIPQLNPPGTVSVELDSDVLVGDGDTEFDRCIIGKFIQIEGDCTAYEVIECLAPVGGSPEGGMQLKLDRPYEGTTDSLLNYIICGHPNRLYISEPLEPEYWPGVNFLDVDPGDGDRLMGMISNFNRLVICKRRKTYVVSFREQPIAEIIVPTLISKDIGCIAPRSVAEISSGSVWLSDRGLAIYDGRGVGAVPESSIANDLFVNPDNPNYLRRDANGRALGAAGVFYPKREQYLLLLPTVKTNRGASMLMVWDTELRNITLLEFCQEFLSIEVAKDSNGNERVYLGDTNGFVWIWDVGDTDGAGFPNATGTVRGTITGAGVDATTGASYLEDGTASFYAGGVPGLADLSGLAGTSGLTGQSNMGLAGACVFWRAADAELGAPWQSRFIYLSTPTRLYVTPNWAGDTPSVGDDYMIGPIEFRAEFKPSNYGTDDFTKRDWRQVIIHEPEAVSTTLRTELLRDFQNSDVDEDTVTDAAGVAGLGRNFDLGFGQGRQIRQVGRLVHNFMGVRLSNFAPDEPLTIINHLLMLTPRVSK